MVKTKLAPAAGRRAVELAIVARGSALLTASDLASTRQRAFEEFPSPLRPQFLKHSDDQTLAALTALAAAIRAHDVACDFHDWAILSSTRYLGRTAFAAVIDKYQIDGPWGVSVQVIPHTAPHALAGTVSLALGSHGPSIGVGAARGEESQALLAAATLLQTQDVRGAWIVLSGWCAEAEVLGPSEVGVGRGAICAATALAVVNLPADAPNEHRSVGRILLEACPPEPTAAVSPDQGEAAPLTELLARRPAANVRWEKTCLGMRARVELRPDELLPSQLRAPRAA